MQLNQTILQNLLAMQNECLAKIAHCKSAGWEIPERLSETLLATNAEIDKVKREMIEQSLLESQNPSIKKDRND